MATFQYDLVDSTKLIRCILSPGETEISLPSHVNRIGSNVFKGNQQLISISGEAVTEIDASVFAYCGSLERASFPQLKEMHNAVFMSCQSLREVFCPCLNKMGDEVFFECHAMQEIYFPQLTEMGAKVFMRCTSLKVALFPQLKRVSPLGPVFFQCTSLQVAYLPNLGILGAEMFDYCTMLTVLVLSQNVLLPYLRLLTFAEWLITCSNLQYILILSNSGDKKLPGWVSLLPTEIQKCVTFNPCKWNLYHSLLDTYVDNQPVLPMLHYRSITGTAPRLNPNRKKRAYLERVPLLDPELRDLNGFIDEKLFEGPALEKYHQRLAAASSSYDLSSEGAAEAYSDPTDEGFGAGAGAGAAAPAPVDLGSLSPLSAVASGPSIVSRFGAWPSTVGFDPEATASVSTSKKLKLLPGWHRNEELPPTLPFMWE